MAYIAVINLSTNKVENVVAPPGLSNKNGKLVPDVWFAPKGYDAVLIESGDVAIGDDYDPDTEEFSRPDPKPVE